MGVRSRRRSRRTARLCGALAAALLALDFSAAALAFGPGPQAAACCCKHRGARCHCPACSHQDDGDSHARLQTCDASSPLPLIAARRQPVLTPAVLALALLPSWPVAPPSLPAPPSRQPAEVPTPPPLA
jgi:hypothetical protein